MLMFRELPYDKDNAQCDGTWEKQSFVVFLNFWVETGPEVIKRFSCSAQLRLKFYPAYKR